MSEEIKQKWIAGFWKRLGAILIDFLMLGFLGFILGYLFEDAFVAIGGWGRLVGFSIALLYFGILNSKLSGGQTIGKAVLNIKVVDANNEELTLLKSFARSTILLAPYFLNHARFTNQLMESFLIYPLTIIIFGGLISTVYLIIFNRKTRQSLHDLLIGTFVINMKAEKQQVESPWKTHTIIVSLIFILSGIAPLFTSQFAQNNPFKELLTTQKALSNYPGVSYATIMAGKNFFSSAGKEQKITTYISAEISILNNKNITDVNLAHNLAILIIKNYPESNKMDVIQIFLTYKYDLGIWSQLYRTKFEFKPTDLQ